jgi:hypothetical protein
MHLIARPWVDTDIIVSVAITVAAAGRAVAFIISRKVSTAVSGFLRAGAVSIAAGSGGHLAGIISTVAVIIAKAD